MLWLLLAILFIFWLFGYALSLGGDLIHFLLVVILLVVVYRLITGRRIE